jgi:hypothetical protein
MPPAFDYLGGICAGTYPVNEFRFLLHLIVFFCSPPSKGAGVISPCSHKKENVLWVYRPRPWHPLYEIRICLVAVKILPDIHPAGRTETKAEPLLYSVNKYVIPSRCCRESFDVCWSAVVE